jgi:hypothetical protein
MNSGGIISGVLFVAGMAAIITSSGAMINMLAGDAMVALAGLSFFKLSR